MKPPTNFSVAWKDVEDAAKDVFSRTTVPSSEIGWARSAWEYLSKAGLCSFESELQRCKCLIRFIALALLYNDFCDIFFDESSDGNYCQLSESPRISAFRLGQLVGLQADWSDSNDDDDDELMSRAVGYLAKQARPAVYDALIKGFGSSHNLFVSLCSAADGYYDSDGSHDEDEDYLDQIFSQESVFSEIAEAYSWVDQGCPPEC